MNDFLTSDWFSMEMLRLLVNPLEVTEFLNTKWNPDFKKPFAVGDVVNIKYPPQFLIRNGMGYAAQGIQQIQTQVRCNQAFGIDFEWDDIEAALKLERGDDRQSELYIRNPLEQIASEWDSRSAQFCYQNFNNITGILGTDPTSLQSYSNAARQRVKEMAGDVPGKSGVVIPPQVNTSLAPVISAFMNPTDEVSRAFKKGIIGQHAGYNWHESMSLYDHTAGTWAGAVTVSGAGQSGTALVITATAADTFLIGDVVGLGGVNNVNPRTRRRTNSTNTKTIVITQNLVAAGGAGADTINFLPAIYGPGSPYQNVTALPANGATLTLFPGTTSPNGKTGKNGLLIHQDAVAIVNVLLELPKNQQIARQQRHPKTGMGCRFVRGWDIDQAKTKNRFDTLGGYGPLYTDNCGVRLLSA